MTLTNIIHHFKKALSGEEEDFTVGSIRKAIFYLSIPMILEMLMESLFAVVDIFFVGKLGVQAVATVGLTESVLTIVYSVAIGLSMAATAVVARRIGEKKKKAASQAAFQAIIICAVLAMTIGVLGLFFAKDLLTLMGGDPALVASGFGYTQVIFAGNISVMLLFLINGVFRGAGNAVIAMRTLWLANGINIVLDPMLIFGIGFFPELGLEGAAWATTIGRSVGVLFQLSVLFRGKAIISFNWDVLRFRWYTVKNILKIAIGGMGQFLIESASWIVLMRIVSNSGSVALAGFTIAIRLIIFALLPAMGFSNASATLVGQNLGAKRPDRAEQSAWKAAHYTALFLGSIGLLFFFFGEYIISWFNDNPEVIQVGTDGLGIICLGYVFFAYGMVMSQSLNGAGDTKTPTLINIVVLWLFQLPLAYVLSQWFDMGEIGVFIAIAVGHSVHALVSGFIFNQGKWKLKEV
ncbi:MATE family efflux transporter [Echinicola vietnamensis]|uniref:Multidrug-efflux transporter n=1 Tax=Echinicola vietnamensis (strain DSM 17526 / LMG 23754 / KMM 6221) TaxID=926556 RepID=L0FYQ2_ECHVK|nr:MATE family efflux transporter [Echinicola vietnamensis]AGA79024.1 putative efflux protein, MATE family [Echinicola vietnamensis DSM 17526]